MTAAPSLKPEPTRSWRGAFVDLSREHGFEPLRVEGQLPADLRGTLYRNGPSLFGAQGFAYQHWFDGDGAVSALRLRDGQAEGAVRVVQSPGLLAERKAGKHLFGTYGTPPAGNLVQRLRRGQKNSANTSVIVWQSRLFALNEGGKPVELSPEDLSTLGETDLGGAVLQAFSAHPHRVPARKATYNVGSRFGGKPALDIYELPDQGPARLLTTLAMPGVMMVHDFICTDRHLLLFLPPYRARLLGLILGRESFGESLAWRPELGTEVVVIPLDAPEQVTRFTTEPFFQWHFANAFERGGELVVDYVRLPDFRSNAWLGELPHHEPGFAWDGNLHRATIDLQQRTLRSERLWEAPCEFPRIASSAIGQSQRYSYLASSSSPEAARGLFDRVARFDHQTGQAEVLALGPGQYPSEPVFVKKAQHAREDDGYLLTLVYDALAHESHVAVLDAARLGEGPVARCYFGHHLPFTFHGNWAAAR